MNDPVRHHSILRTEILTGDARTEPVSLRVFCKRRGRSLPIAECMGCARLAHARLTSDARLTAIECDDTSGVNTPNDAASEPVGALLKGTVVCVAEDATLSEVVEDMVNLGLEDAPVIDAEGRYYGVIRESGLVGMAKDDVARDALIRAAAVSENDTVYDAVVHMARTHQREIPVLSAEGVVIGVLRDVDAIRWLKRARDSV